MIARKLEELRSKLLDTSRRNRLLNFKPKGNRSIRVHGQSASDLYQWLVGDKKRLNFVPREGRSDQLFNDDALGPDGAAIVNDQRNAAMRLAPKSDRDVQVKPMTIPPYGRGEKRQPDTRLAGAAAPEATTREDSQPTAPPGQILVDLVEDKLDQRLLFLAREAVSAIQEQGCNVLYASFGLIDWLDPNERSGKSSAAPLVLVPVELARKNAAQRFQLIATDEEPSVNPTLVELCKSKYGLELPALDHDAAAPLDDFFSALQDLLAGSTCKKWSIRKEVHVGLFSFAKLLMYRDLCPEQWPAGQSIAEHPLVMRLLGSAPDDQTDVALPDPRAIDEEVHPQDCFQVRDADSSQQVAILAAKRGASMVIEGPPGTGKSQTITNIIAEFIAAGKTVLFVAEKAAALDVVKRNLDRVGLGEFALSIHSRKATRRAISDELLRTINFDRGCKPSQDGSAEELFRLRSRLNEYVKRLHEKIAPLGISRFEAMAECARLRGAPEAPFAIRDISAWDSRRLDSARELIESLARAASRVGNPALHPWRGVGLSEIPLVVRQEIPNTLADLMAAVVETKRSGDELASFLGAPAPRRRRDECDLIATANTLLKARTLDAARAPKIGAAAPADLPTILACGRAVTSLRAETRVRWNASAELVDWRQITARRRRQICSLLRWLRLSWHRDTAAMRKHLVKGVDAHQPDVVDDLEKLVNLRERLEQHRRLTPRGRAIFGTLWHDNAEDWQGVESHATEVEEVRQLIAQGRTTTKAIPNICTESGRRRLRHLADAFAAACANMSQRHKRIGDLLRLDFRAFLGDEPDNTTFGDWQQRLQQCAKAAETISDWADRARLAQECKKAFGLDGFVEWCERRGGQLTAEDQCGAFCRQFYRLWLETTVASLRDFRLPRGDDLQAIIDRFREADHKWLDATRERLIAVADSRRPKKSQAVGKSLLDELETELRKKRGIKPIRELFGQSGGIIVALKPCFLMSPMSVAQHLKPGKLGFDVVIFDEASQVEPADALGAIARAKQVILVGDEKQLPPTNFFGKVNDAEAGDEAGDNDSLNTKDLESVLAMGAVCLHAKTTLRWHYRSQHDSLIQFSNEAFYNRQLRVFASPQRSREELGLSFRHVANGVYFRGRGQYNEVEAREVARAVIEHARKSPTISLGVGAFSLAQQRAIEDEVERMRRASSNAALEEFFNREDNEPFFVKNLETIQGDEREVIFLSVGYGPDENKRLTANFGPLNRDGGWRRLNVLVTRGRRRCVVFASFTADQLQLPPNAPRGVQALKDYLQFAEHGTLPAIQQYREDHESPFEADVCNELRERGYTVHAQVGCAGFSIDLAVVDPKRPGRYLLGIECDGATYHSSATARDRDRLRQEVLENLRWRIFRVWSTDWFERRADTLDRLLGHINGLAILPSN